MRDVPLYGVGCDVLSTHACGIIFESETVASATLGRSVRDPASLSRANGAQLVVDHFLRDWRLMKKKKKHHVLPYRQLLSPDVCFEGWGTECR